MVQIVHFSFGFYDYTDLVYVKSNESLVVEKEVVLTELAIKDFAKCILNP